jgi:hypothetical protein
MAFAAITGNPIRMNISMVEAIVAAFGFLTALCGLVVYYLKYKEKARECDQAIREMRFQRAALSFPDFVAEWGEASKDLINLLETTCIDRFMILRAWNGHLEPRWTTSVYQLRSGDQAPIAYIHFELDQDYVIKVRETVASGSMYMTTETMEPSEIRSVYEAEGVTASLWAHIDTFDVPGSTSKAVAYCSFATHDPAGIDAHTQTLCKIVTGRLKGLAHSFDRNSMEKVL